MLQAHAGITRPTIDSLKQLAQSEIDEIQAEALLRLSKRCFSIDMDSSLYFDSRAYENPAGDSLRAIIKATYCLSVRKKGPVCW